MLSIPEEALAEIAVDALGVVENAMLQVKKAADREAVLQQKIQELSSELASMRKQAAQPPRVELVKVAAGVDEGKAGQVADSLFKLAILNSSQREQMRAALIEDPSRAFDVAIKLASHIPALKEGLGTSIDMTGKHTGKLQKQKSSWERVFELAGVN